LALMKPSAATVVCLVLGVAFMWFYTFLCWRDNRKRDQMGETAREDHAFHDYTDKQNLSFRYEL
jgi:hypothetical protein